MNIFLYGTLFLIGIIVGYFLENEIYRIPRNISITKKYVLRLDSSNKSKFSKKVVKLLYLLLGGVLFVLFAKEFKIYTNKFNLSSIILYIFTILYVAVLTVIAGIDKEHIKIEKKVISRGILLSLIYIVYLYIVEATSIYVNIVYLGIYVILLTIDTFLVRRYAKDSYEIGILMLFNFILIFSGMEIYMYTMLMVLIEILVSLLISKVAQKKNGNKKIKLNKIPVGYFIGVSNIIVFVMIVFFKNYYIILKG